MGACDFESRGFGKTVRDAFRSAREEAQYLYGHAGYTGTIAEKDSVIEYEVPKGITADDFIQLVRHLRFVSYDSDDVRLLEWTDERLVKLWESLDGSARRTIGKAFRETDDKWGPAGAVCLGHTPLCGDDNVYEFVFFGWASE